MRKWNLDNYKNVVNGLNTFKEIANELKAGHSVFIGWEDSDTHYDILFNFNPVGKGYYQRGIRTTDLFVSIISLGSFGFSVESFKSPGYIAEKLFYKRMDSSVENVTKLINGVILELKGIM